MQNKKTLYVKKKNKKIPIEHTFKYITQLKIKPSTKQ